VCVLRDLQMKRRLLSRVLSTFICEQRMKIPQKIILRFGAV
jgi:hypothetical protein